MAYLKENEGKLVIKNHCIIHIFHKTNGDEALT